jgi:acetyl/propionyl-CoA carboxylase alpha subunit/acetyl-CoA carboxylase carboxyltransferase component
MKLDFARVAIVNRGEAAMRFISAAREYNLECGTNLRTIALFTEPDRRAMFVREADEAYDLGPALFLDPRGGSRKSSYLDHARLERAFRETGADAVWAGWGFVAEQAEFVAMLERQGIVFIGPTAAAVRRLSDKIAAKRLAEAVGVPVVPWTGGAVASLDAAHIAAKQLGYPLMVKASAGGGGRGIRRAAAVEALPEAFTSARAEATRIFGDPTVFIEKCLEGVRHVEVQVMGDHHGALWACGVRDCTIQRRHQKILEESPAPTLTPEQDRALREAATRICRAAEYRNAGTVEFLFEPGTQSFFFIEVNARLQVEHAVTEVTTGLDLVKLQIHVARGGRLEGAPPRPRGYAIEVRLNAEDPDSDFAPAPGTFALFRLPTGPGVRIDRGFTDGDRVPLEFDSMVAKVIASGRDRPEALARVRRALAESVVVLEGGTTNRAFLLDLLSRPEVQSGEVDTGWLERAMTEPPHRRLHADVAFVQAAIEVYESEFARERARFYETAARLRPELPSDSSRLIELHHGGESYKARVFRLGPQEYRLHVDGHRLDARVEPLGRFERRIFLGERRHRVISVPQGSRRLVEVDGIPHLFARADLGIVRAGFPAVVVSLAVKRGDEVKAGDALAVLEAMKMETTVVAAFAGRVRDVLVTPNMQVAPGAPLVQVDAGVADASLSAGRIAFPGAALRAAATPREGALANLDAMRRLVLGFDADPADVKALAEDYVRLARDWPGDGQRRRIEDEILGIFADLASLCRRQASPEEDEALGSTSAGEYFLTYLRTVDATSPRLPRRFRESLERAVAHYGLEGLERTPLLLDVLFWVFKAQRGLESAVPVALAILERRMEAPEPDTDADFTALLDRLIGASEGRRPSLCDVAREVRYRLVDKPLYEARRKQVYAEAETHLESLRDQPDVLEREKLIAALVACPQPLQRLVSARLEGETPGMQELLLEILVRRYYRIRDLEEIHVERASRRAVARAAYALDGRRVNLLATHGRVTDLSELLSGLGPRLAAVPSGEDVVLDLCLWEEGALGPASDNAELLRSALDSALGARRPRRVGITLGAPGNGHWQSALQYFTFRSGPTGFREDPLYRGFHTMIGKRLRLWRMGEFELERLPSAEDVYVFRGVARENPKDERIFGVAEVRDVTPVRDGAGRLIAVPHLERMFMEALAPIRVFQSRRRPDERLYWNRILLDVAPPLPFNRDEIMAMARKLLPATEGLGIDSVFLRADLPDPRTGDLVDSMLVLSSPGRSGLSIREVPSGSEPIHPLSEYGQKVTRLRQRGLVYPYEIVRLMTPATGVRSDFPPGTFQELDLDPQGELVPVERAYGKNTTNVVVGLIRSATPRYPEGMKRVMLLGDPSREMGSLAEPECRRILAALDLAEGLRAPVEWFALSAGAKIAMDSGTENMDWISRVLRRLVQFTQAGGEVNLVICGINVGAQPYWNAEATMLMHTRGILVMVPEAAMVLTGKTALDYSGSVSAEDNLGIGGYDRIMGPNGEAQYWAHDIAEACSILFRHYEHTYVAPDERFPRRAATRDPHDRDVRSFPHDGGFDGFALVGDVLSDESNPGRKKPFAIRRVMAACADQDHPVLERWAGWRDAEIGVVWDAHLGGIPVCMLGFESRPLPRLGFAPTDGPEHWTSGTLFPQSSKKIARAINAASANRPVVILANLSGFDGSPESMRRWQLEYGAEIGRAVVNFEGPIVFVVVSRYHGGAFVVFSKALNENMEVAALEGTHASVIGGAPAAAVVFAREVDTRTKKDPRVLAVEADLQAAPEAERRRLRGHLTDVLRAVRSEKLGEVADEFDRTHSVDRALRVGSLDRIIPPAELRPYLISAVERGMARYLAHHRTRAGAGAETGS